MIYIETDSEDAYFNFGVEEFIVSEGNISETVFLFWRTRPTLMVGNYQNVYSEINLPYAKSHGIDVVRRRSGGGTIYTDENGWQFSYFYPGAKGGEADFASSAAQVVRALRTLGVPAEFNGRNDVTADGRKISGNARYVTPKGVLHHGSLLFDTDVEQMVRAISPSEDKIVSKGIASVRQRVANVSEFLTEKMTSLEFKHKMLGLLLTEKDIVLTLSPAERAHIESLADQKYRNWERIYAEGPKFEISRSRRFAGGLLECCLSVREGRVSALEFRGDFFANSPPERLAEGLAGCLYERNAIRKRLAELGAEAVFFKITEENILDCLAD